MDLVLKKNLDVHTCILEQGKAQNPRNYVQQVKRI